MKTANVSKKKAPGAGGLKKPPKNEATKWFIKFGIPFCNARTAGDLFRTAIEILHSHGGKSSNSGEWKVWNKELKNNEKLDWDEKFFHLEEVATTMAELDITKFIACRMIDQATRDRKRYSDGGAFILHEFLGAIKKYFQPSIKWGGKEKNFIYRLRAQKKNEQFGEYFCGSVKAILLSKLIKAFAHKPNEKAPGSFYISCCNKCNRVFERTRKDKKYCDDYCLELQLKRNSRKNQTPLK